MNDIDKDPQRTPEEGRVKPPYGGAIHCSNSECRGVLNEELGAYLHKDREAGGVLLFCGTCSIHAQLYDNLRYPLVAL